MKYYFTDKEKSAIVDVAVSMEAADGKEDLRESLINIKIFQYLNISSDAVENAKSLSLLDSMAIIKNMTQDEKKFVCSCLAAIMCADKEIDEKEMTLWKLISTICEFPTMHIKEALKYFIDNVE